MQHWQQQHRQHWQQQHTGVIIHWNQRDYFFLQSFAMPTLPPIWTDSDKAHQRYVKLSSKTWVGGLCSAEEAFLLSTCSPRFESKLRQYYFVYCLVCGQYWDKNPSSTKQWRLQMLLAVTSRAKNYKKEKRSKTRVVPIITQIMQEARRLSWLKWSEVI